MISIKAIRIKRGIIVKEVAEALNVAETTVFRWESGAREPSISTLKGLSALYECELSELVRDYPVKTSSDLLNPTRPPRTAGEEAITATA